MEAIFSILFVLTIVAIADQRKNDRAMFPPGPCASCHEPIHHSRRAGRWLHADGNEYSSIRNYHPAVPILHPWDAAQGPVELDDDA